MLKFVDCGDGYTHRMIWVDYCILGILALSVLIGLLRGFVREVLGVATWVLAILATYLLGDTTAHALDAYIETPAVRLAAGYTLVFLFSLLLGAVVTHLVALLVRDGPIAAIDRTVGAGFGLVRGFVVLVVVVMIAGTTAARDDRWWRESTLIPLLVPFADAARPLVPERWLALLRPQPVPSPVHQSAARLAGGS